MLPTVSKGRSPSTSRANPMFPRYLCRIVKELWSLYLSQNMKKQPLDNGSLCHGAKTRAKRKLRQRPLAPRRRRWRCSATGYWKTSLDRSVWCRSANAWCHGANKDYLNKDGQ